jgi:hypothetical protein
MTAVYALLLLQNETIDPSLHYLRILLWWLPPSFALFGFFRWRDDVDVITSIAAYIRAHELEFISENGGWEHFIQRRRDEQTGLRRWWRDLVQRFFGRVDLVTVNRLMFWISILRVTCLIALIETGRFLLADEARVRYIGAS